MINLKTIFKSYFIYHLILFSIFTVFAGSPLIRYETNQSTVSPTKQLKLIEVKLLPPGDVCSVSEYGHYPPNFSFPCTINVDTSRYDPLYFELEAELFCEPDIGGILNVQEEDVLVDYILPNIYIANSNKWTKWKTSTNTLLIKDTYNLTVTLFANGTNLTQAKNIVLRLYLLVK